MGIPLLIVGGQTADVHNTGDIAVKFFRRDDPVLAHRLPDDLSDRKPGR